MQDAQKRVPIGVSFPEYVNDDKFNLLGSKLRLFANDETTLERFNVEKWLSRLNDYVHYTNIHQVPEKLKGYAIYQREQVKSNKERLARRYAMRHNIDYEKALALYSNMTNKKTTTPFINLKSLSSDNDFCLKIKKKLVKESSGNIFNSYGISSVSSVPEFYPFFFTL